MKRFLREPLVHFLVLGALLFAAHRFVTNGGGRGEGNIVVTQGQIRNLATLFERTWRRPPDPSELQGLIDGHVREEVLYREGLALGLDRDDPVIRQRVRLKMELLSEDAAAFVEPTDRDLQAYLDAHAAQFAEPPRYTFRQVFLDPLRHADDLEPETRNLLARLERLGKAEATDGLGDATMVPHRFEAVSSADIARTFGEGFAQALTASDPGRWVGPLRSGYGVHLVLIEERTEARKAGLAEVRDQVAREWARDRSAAASEAVYKELRQRYRVTIESPQAAETASADNRP